MIGEKTFDHRSLPVIFRDNSDLEALNAKNWKPGDLHIVEISSAKRLTAFGDELQSNYFTRTVSNLFSEQATAAKYWALMRTQDHAALEHLVAAMDAGRAMDPHLRELLGSARLTTQDETSIARDLAAIVDILGADRTVFVTHVDGRKPDGKPIAMRSRLIEAVKVAARRLGVACFDPTEAMLRVGQDVALLRGGADLTHYTTGFSDLVFHEIQSQFIRPRFGEIGHKPDDQIRRDIADQILVENITLVASRNWRDGDDMLTKALAERPDAAGLLELKAQRLLSEGEPEEAAAMLADLAARQPLSSNGQKVLLQAYVHLRKWAEALDCHKSLLEDEIDDAIVLANAGLARENLGQPETALDLYLQAYGKDPFQIGAALAALALLEQAGDIARAASLRDRIARNSETGCSEAAILMAWADRHGDAGMSELGQRIMPAPAFAPQCAEAEAALAAGNPRLAAEAIATLANQAARDAAAHRRVQRLADDIVRSANSAVADRDYALGLALYDAVTPIVGAKASAARQAAMREFRTAFFALFTDGQFEAAARFAAKAPDLVQESAELALRWAVSLQKLGRIDEALDVISVTHEKSPKDIAVLRMYARLAAIGWRYDLAYPLFRDLQNNENPEARQHSVEIERFFDNAERRALKNLRDRTEACEFDIAVAIWQEIGSDIVDVERHRTFTHDLVLAMQEHLQTLQPDGADDDNLGPRLLRNIAMMGREHGPAMSPSSGLSQIGHVQD
ncbi:hypothetical protein EKN06_09290 [Croceicoccus ponticola]|uniref:Tetratricopeptide repeat protein n=1 Tax=Croceicoccus ponticola TaxID=2217664 RepID=A0A437GXI7_9SPHN|nr:hypothetical protein [Croceicoccus ponticola]RVQ67104.1 hypothetical protein EKN06_09290 [Croceicoccus ponticola]